MGAQLLETPIRTLADLLRDLGDISPGRVRFPAGGATEEDVIRLLHAPDKRIYELVDGVLVEKAVGLRESLLAAFIGRMLGNFVDEHDLGIVTGADGPFRLKKGRIRFPDTSFVSWSKFPGGELPDDPICDVVPDLAVEVISDSNTDDEMDRKLKDYFEAGVRLVWYVYPPTKTAEAYTSPTKKKDVEIGGKIDSLDGGRVLPGFSLPLSKVFARFKRRK